MEVRGHFHGTNALSPSGKEPTIPIG